jgi:hypothetical protein
LVNNLHRYSEGVQITSVAMLIAATRAKAGDEQLHVTEGERSSASRRMQYADYDFIRFYILWMAHPKP